MRPTKLLGTIKHKYIRAISKLSATRLQQGLTTGHQKDAYVCYGILSAVPFQLCSLLFADIFLIPVIGRKITVETQNKVHCKNSKF